MIRLAAPSYLNGFAPRDGRPAFPNLWKGLRGLWVPSLGPTGLTLFDWSGFKKHVSLANAPTWGVGRFGSTIDMDGDNDLFTLPTTGLLPGPAASIVIWIKPNAGYGQGTHAGVAYRFPFGIFIATATGNLWGRVLEDDGGSGTFAQVGTVAVDEWSCIVVTADGAVGRQYLNGQFQDDVAYDGTLENASGQIIGHQGNNQFDGMIGPISVYDRALAAAEIQQLYVDPYALTRLRRRVFAVAVAGHPAMRRWGGVPHMTPGPVLAGRSW